MRLACATGLVFALAVSGTRPVAAGQPQSGPIDLPWVRIAAGSFNIGCVPGDEACQESERPRHQVTISRPFDLMATEVTVAQYYAFVTTTGYPAPEPPDYPQEPAHPVVFLSWDDAQSFCQWAGGRLPTEAEWEYAARAGRDGLIYGWTNDLSHEWANFGQDECCEGATAGRDQWFNTAPVGSFPPNDFGLYDMTGNVWEWVADWFDDTYYTPAAITDPPGPAAGLGRVARGGSWLNFPQVLRTSVRLVFSPDGQTSNVGTRCARDTEAVAVAD